MGWDLYSRIARSGRHEFQRGDGNTCSSPGRKIQYIRADVQEARHALLNTGMSENLADLLLEMYDACEMGRLQPLQPRSLESTTPTTLGDFAHDVMLPLVGQPVSS